MSRSRRRQGQRQPGFEVFGQVFGPPAKTVVSLRGEGPRRARQRDAPLRRGH